jgi:putative tryptophan/tyrosine transport system substrate-binding protein
MMDRRAFIATLGLGFLSSSLGAEGQPAVKAPARLGYIVNADQTTAAPFVEAFRQGLRDLGWVEGQNVSIQYRWAEGNVDRLPVFAAELVRLKMDVFIASGGPALRTLQQATSTIPIVSAAFLGDPVDAGFAASLARPGGNITGLASQYEELVTKHVQLLAEAVPKLSRVILLHHTSVNPVTARTAAAAADKLGLKARVLEVSQVLEFEGAFRAARDYRAQALLVLPSPILNAHRRVLIKLAASYRLPAFYEFKEYVQDGGLMSYGPNIADMYRRAASYVDRILNGAKPGDLPFERPAKFELVVNMRTAKALGLTIPPSILVRADQVIE